MGQTTKKMKGNSNVQHINWFSVGCVFVFGLSVAIIHYIYVSTLFENDRHFSHLSTLEREMTFRTEMGFYFSYYKTLIEAPSFSAGMFALTHDNLTEYPKTINALHRFNLYPEVVSGFFYRLLNSLGLLSKQCWQVDRGAGLSSVTSCEGLGDPMYFYLEVVWICAGLTTAILFFYAFYLSDSLAGGFISVLSFFYNHAECTRVQWTPPLRESFAYPYCLLQMYFVTLCLSNSSKSSFFNSKLRLFLQLMAISQSSCICFITWQFSQFVFLTQAVIIFLLFIFQAIPMITASIILTGLSIGLVQAIILLMGNGLLVSSLLSCFLLTVLFTMHTLHGTLPTEKRPLLCSVVYLFSTTILMILFKCAIFSSNQDTHIFRLLWSKFSNYKDFDTLLYTCAPEFDFLPLETLYKFWYTWLLSCVMLVLFFLGVRWYQTCRISHNFRILGDLDPAVVYNVLQLFAFAIMAALIMRLKLFFTPHMCLVMSLLFSRKYMLKMRVELPISIMALIVAGMSFGGIPNILHQLNIMGEYSNVPLEELLTWIHMSTEKKAVFAGPMPVMAAILLSTRRPIVNHPHYEDAELRERTKMVYTVFSRKPIYEIYENLLKLKVDYVVLEDSWCFKESRRGCSMVNIWDVEDPSNKNNPPICRQLFLGKMQHFLKVFSNQVFVVLRLQPRFVEIKDLNRFQL